MMHARYAFHCDADSAFKQQRLASWQLVLTPKWVIGLLVLVAVLFIPIGAGIVAASRSYKEYKVGLTCSAALLLPVAAAVLACNVH